MHMDSSGSADSPRSTTRSRRPSSLIPSSLPSPRLARRSSGKPDLEKEATSESPAPSPSLVEHTMLPPPAVAFIPPDASSKLRVTWAKLKRRIGNGSVPSESLGDPTATTESDGGSTFGRRRTGMNDEKAGDEEEEVNEVVVEQTSEYDCWKKTTLPSNTASHRAGGTGTTPGTATGPLGTLQSDASSLRQTAYEANGPIDAVLGFARYRLWPILSRFFVPTYHDPDVEESFQKEQWYNSKSLHIFGAFFLTLNWILTISLLPHPWSTWNKVQNYGIGPALAVPLIPLAAFDVPRRQPYIWQLLVFACIWINAAANPIDMYGCGFYTRDASCGKKDFMATLYYVVAGPTVALFALGAKRIFVLTYSLSWLILVSVTILPRRPSFARNVVNVVLFQGFIIFIHYMREMADRRMYTMRSELKISFKAKQRAQINERKMMDAKRRFSSYIFHEVRVPLNTALLAVQNLKANMAFDQNSEFGIEYDALEGSLQMMSQVLNDVLDFSRMERGGFSSVSRPFSLHNVMRSIFVPLRLDVAARGLALETSLDTRVDQLALEAAFPNEEIGDVREGEGRLMGDEMRLRQIIGNLISNACKFTPAGGKISIQTELIYPLEEYDTPQHLPTPAELAGLDTAISDDTEKTQTYSPRLSENRLHQHEKKTAPQPKEMLVVRFIVTDTGVGIKKSDMAENRLFTPYVQTAVGREQGGKGTGLGLSLVRQIVMLSGGRLSVQSRYGKGTSMIIDLPFAIGPQTRAAGDEIPRNRFRTGTDAMAISVEKDKNGNLPITPNTDSSAGSDYRFVSSLRKRNSDPTVNSIDETTEPSPVRQRDSSVSTQLSIPLAYRYPPGTSPPLLTGPPSPSIVFSQSTPPSQSPTGLQGIPVYPQTTASPLGFSHPFALAPPRPDNRSHISSASAPAEVTVPPHLTTPSSPVVSASRTSSRINVTPKPDASNSTALVFPDGPLRVLVVDDDTLTRRLMSRMMQRLGCTTSTAENGKIALDLLLAPPPPGAAASCVADSEEVEALEGVQDEVDAAEKGLPSSTILQKKPKPKKVSMDPTAGIDAYKHYDIVFLDNQMPICSGVQVVAKLRSLGRDDLVVGVTANALLSDQEQYLESGASYILTKPVKESDLKKYLLVADKRRVEAKDPALRRQRQATSILSGPSFPAPPSVHGLENEI
ncbi:hypothetical protein JCM11641_000734 [Rhodosporidiobolus odoratus]